MRACVVKDYAVMVNDREVEARARLMADIARDRDPSYPAWENLPAHTQRDLIETARKGFEQEGAEGAEGAEAPKLSAKDRIRSMIGSGLREKWL